LRMKIIDPFKRTTDTVCMVGMANTSREDAPFDDPNVEIWVINEMINQGHSHYTWIPRWDRSIQIHEEWDFSRAGNHNDEQHYLCLQQDHGKPIYMQDVFPAIPNSVKYPKEEIEAKFVADFLRGPKDERDKYWTSSPCYMLALALYLGFPMIRLYGFEMSSQTEYMYQRDGVSFWLGTINGTPGSKFWLPEGCQLLSGPVYGYEGGTLIPKAKFLERKAELEKGQQETENKIKSIIDEGEMQAYLLAQTNPRNSKKRKELNEQIAAINKKRIETMWKYNQFVGAIEANNFWIGVCDDVTDTGIQGQVRRQILEIRNRAIKSKHEEAKAKANQANGFVVIRQKEYARAKEKNEKRRLQKEMEKAAKDRDEKLAVFHGLTGMVEENKRWIAYVDQKLVVPLDTIKEVE